MLIDIWVPQTVSYVQDGGDLLAFSYCLGGLGPRDFVGSIDIYCGKVKVT